MQRSTLYRLVLLVGFAWLLIIVFVFAPGLFQAQNTDSQTLIQARSERIESLRHSKQKVFYKNGTHRLSLNLTAHSTPVHVFYSTDEGSLLGLIASINSVRSNTKSPLHFHILTTKTLEKPLHDWLADPRLSGSLYDIRVMDTDIAKMVDGKQGENVMSYAMLFYADMFSDVRGKAVHLDTDTVVQGDISEMVSTSLGEHCIAVSEDCHAASKHVTSYKPQYSAFLNFRSPLIKALNMSASTCTFNAGVYVADLDCWRKHNITRELSDWMKRNKAGSLWGGEPGGSGPLPPLLIVFHQKYAKLSPMWHVRHLGWRVRETFSSNFISHAKLLHWSGKYKPWAGRSQFTKIWDKYYVPDPQRKYKPIRKIHSQT